MMGSRHSTPFSVQRKKYETKQVSNNCVEKQTVFIDKYCKTKQDYSVDLGLYTPSPQQHPKDYNNHSGASQAPCDVKSQV